MDVRTGNGPRTNDEDYDQNYHTFRGKLLLEPTDTLDILLSGDFTSREENRCTAVQTTVGATAGILNALVGGKAVGAPGDDPFDRVAYSNRPTMQDMKDRSEEHTSELQSLMRISYAVFCLKKKKKQWNEIQTTIQTN